MIAAKMTKKQSSFIRKLLEERAGVEEAEALRRMLDQLRESESEMLTTKVASATIEKLLTIKPVTARKSDATVELEDGMYRNKFDEIVKVYHTVRGANQQVAKILVLHEYDGWDFQYAGKRGLHGLTPEHRMTLEEAKEFGAIYGVCCVCGAALTNEDSVKAGIGPVCAGRV